MADSPVTDEMLMALADGVLEEPEASRVAARVASDPALARRLAALRLGGEAARRAYADVAGQPVPDRLVAAVLAADAVAAPTRPPAPANQPRWRGRAAAAAAVLVALALGVVAGRHSAPESDRLAAPTPLLSAALSGAASGETLSTGAASVTVLATHRLADGAICRAFSTSGAEAASGLACRTGGAWQVIALVRRDSPAAGFRPASGLDPALEAVLDRRGAGAPLGEAEEAALRAGGW